MSRLSDATVDAIKQAVDLVTLASEYGLALQRAGSKYKSLCPFHDDHNPSLYLDPDRQSYKCWSCGAGGDVIAFVQGFERVDFIEALRMLAERAGISLESPADRSAAPAGPSKSDLLAACAWAQQQFTAALTASPSALEYARSRHLSPASQTRFGLGLAPDDRDWLSARARRQGIGQATLEAAGLIARSEGSNLTRDRFRGRLMFPIRDIQGRPVAFGGRILPETEAKWAESGRRVAKYLNSPETLLFQKRRTLYAADLARQAARQAGWVAVMEGYTDVIAAHQAGLENVVGTLGTALGDDHVQLLRRLAERVVLVFDGDEAGQKAADRSLELFLGHELELRILTLPGGLDPADYLNAEGAGPFRALVESALDPLDFVIERAGLRYDVESIEGARQAAEWVLGLMAASPRLQRFGVTIKVGQALNNLSRKLRLPVNDRTLPTRLQQLLRQNSRPRAASGRVVDETIPGAPAGDRDRDRHREGSGPMGPPAPALRVSDLDPTDRQLVGLIFEEPALIQVLVRRVPVGLLREGPLRTILSACYDLYAAGEVPSFEMVCSRLDESLRQMAAGLAIHAVETGPLPENVKPAPCEARLEGVLAALEKRDRRERLRDIEAALREIDPATTPKEYEALWRERLRLLSSANRSTAAVTTSPHRPDPRSTTLS